MIKAKKLWLWHALACSGMLWTPLAELILGLSWLRSILQSKSVRVAYSFARHGGVVLEDLPSLLRHGGKSSDRSPNVVLERLEDAFQSIPLLQTKKQAKLSSSQVLSVVIQIVRVCVCVRAKLHQTAILSSAVHRQIKECQHRST